MKKIAIIEETQNRIKSILSSREKDLFYLDDKIIEEEDAIASANAAMADATIVGDLKSYQRAKAERANASDAKEMHEARRSSLANDPLVSSAEYEKVVSEIIAAVKAIEDDAKKRLCELADEMAEIALDLEEVSMAANDTLYNWQHFVYRDADRAKHPKTGEFYMHDDKSVNISSTIHWGRNPSKCSQYINYTRGIE